jgi:hypothetical protein
MRASIVSEPWTEAQRCDCAANHAECRQRGETDYDTASHGDLVLVMARADTIAVPPYPPHPARQCDWWLLSHADRPAQWYAWSPNPGAGSDCRPADFRVGTEIARSRRGWPGLEARLFGTIEACVRGIEPDVTGCSRKMSEDRPVSAGRARRFSAIWGRADSLIVTMMGEARYSLSALLRSDA